MSTPQALRRVQQLVDDVTAGDPHADWDQVPSEPQLNKPQPHYLPTPKEIHDECRRIREGWSEEEHWKRAGYRHGKPGWEVRRYPTLRPEVRA